MYGDDVKIDKEDCINHGSKRMGKALRNLVDQCKSQNQAISGKGKLTAMKVTKIQNYYGRAIKDFNHDIELLKKGFLQSSFICHHQIIIRSIITVHLVKVLGALAKKEPPGSHKSHATLPSDVGKKLVPIFKRLSEDGLLQRCARSRTQNTNESLHNMIWRFCPKSTFAGKRTIEMAVALAVCQFSIGDSFTSVLCRILGIEQGLHSQVFARKKTLKRLKKARIASTDTAKKRRKELKYKKLSLDQNLKDAEGETYSAGAFA